MVVVTASNQLVFHSKSYLTAYHGSTITYMYTTVYCNTVVKLHVSACTETCIHTFNIFFTVYIYYQDSCTHDTIDQLHVSLSVSEYL